MNKGKLKWFNTDKGYGFIQPDDGGKDVFVHITALQRSGLPELEEGTALQYDLEERRGKVCAANLQRVSEDG